MGSMSDPPKLPPPPPMASPRLDEREASRIAEERRAIELKRQGRQSLVVKPGRTDPAFPRTSSGPGLRTPGNLA